MNIGLWGGLMSHINEKLILDYDNDSTYENIKLLFFKKSVGYYENNLILNDSNSYYQNLDSSENDIINIDSITINPSINKTYSYKNIREFFYFCPIHEIEHTKSYNIVFQQLNDFAETEYQAFKKELKAFRKRKRINKKKIIFYK